MNEVVSQALIRSHLSNERTHLSYLRTSLSLISFGVTLNRLSIFLQGLDVEEKISEHAATLSHTALFGLAMVVMGIFLLVWSLIRYKQVNNDISGMKFRNPYYAVLIITGIVMVFATLTAFWIFLSKEVS